MVSNKQSITINQNKNITIILPLKDRVEFTNRWMSYANYISLPFKIFIADGGKDIEIEKKLKNSRNYPNLYYKYFKYPYDNSYSRYFNKLSNIIEKVSTPFVMLVDNDDFVVPLGIIKSINFLEKNPDYISCRGRIDGILIKPSSNKKDKEKYEFRYPSEESVKLNQRRALNRLKVHLSNYSPTFYDVHRTVKINESFSKLKEMDLSDLHLAELATSCISVTQGKIKRNNYPFLVRQMNPPGSSAAEENKKGNFFDRMFSKTWSDDYNTLRIEISNRLSEADNIPKSESPTLFDNYFKSLIFPEIIKNLSKSIPRIPSFLMKIARQVLYIFYNGSPSKKIFLKLASIFRRPKYKRNISQSLSLEENKHISNIVNFLISK